MADIVKSPAIGRDVCLDLRLSPTEPACRRWDQGGEQAQQACFAAAVGAGQQESPTRRQAQRKPGEYKTLAPSASDVFGNQLGLGLPSQLAPGREERVERQVGVCHPNGGLEAKKRLRWGKPEPRGHGRYFRPCTRFGGQTCKGEPYAYHMGSRLGLPFEKIMTFR